MGFSDLLVKISKGQELTPTERQQLQLESRKLEDVLNLINGIIQSGTSNLKVNQLTANNIQISNNTIKVAEDGITVLANDDSAFVDERAYKFKDSDGDIMAGMWATADEVNDTNFLQVQTTSAINGFTNAQTLISAVANGTPFVRLVADESGATDNAEARLSQAGGIGWFHLENVSYFVLDRATVNPAYADGYAILYFYSDGAGVDELRIRAKIGAVETQVTLANLSP